MSACLSFSQSFAPFNGEFGCLLLTPGALLSYLEAYEVSAQRLNLHQLSRTTCFLFPNSTSNSISVNNHVIFFLRPRWNHANITHFFYLITKKYEFKYLGIIEGTCSNQVPENKINVFPNSNPGCATLSLPSCTFWSTLSNPSAIVKLHRASKKNIKGPQQLNWIINTSSLNSQPRTLSNPPSLSSASFYIALKFNTIAYNYIRKALSL